MTELSSHGQMRNRLAAAIAFVTVLTGCGPQSSPSANTDGVARNLSDGAQQVSRAAAGFVAPIARGSSVPPPPRLTGRLQSADVLVVGNSPLTAELLERVDALDQVRAVIPVSVASVLVADRSITVAAVDSASYRNFTPETTATADGVWRAVAAGEIVLNHEIADDLGQPLGGALAVRQSDGELPLRIGAYATTIPRVHAVVNERRGEQLGITRDNALVVALRRDDLATGSWAVKDVVADRAQVAPLRPTIEATVSHTATLAGGTVAKAVGSFSYRYFPDGSVQPQPEWVSANIRTESVPILGAVTCHRVMLPQLRAALTEVERRGLGSAIDPADYGGCYVPRFIGRDPTRGLSLHTWGIAIDLNVASNQRGTAGEIDRNVVTVFKKWGFAWGGDWAWTDPMHFNSQRLSAAEHARGLRLAPVPFGHSESSLAT